MYSSLWADHHFVCTCVPIMSNCMRYVCEQFEHASELLRKEQEIVSVTTTASSTYRWRRWCGGGWASRASSSWWAALASGWRRRRYAWSSNGCSNSTSPSCTWRPAPVRVVLWSESPASSPSTTMTSPATTATISSARRPAPGRRGARSFPAHKIAYEIPTNFDLKKTTTDKWLNELPKWTIDHLFFKNLKKIWRRVGYFKFSVRSYIIGKLSEMLRKWILFGSNVVCRMELGGNKLFLKKHSSKAYLTVHFLMKTASIPTLPRFISVPDPNKRMLSRCWTKTGGDGRRQSTTSCWRWTRPVRATSSGTARATPWGPASVLAPGWPPGGASSTAAPWSTVRNRCSITWSTSSASRRAARRASAPSTGPTTRPWSASASTSGSTATTRLSQRCRRTRRRRARPTEKPLETTCSARNATCTHQVGSSNHSSGTVIDSSSTSST